MTTNEQSPWEAHTDPVVPGTGVLVDVDALLALRLQPSVYDAPRRRAHVDVANNPPHSAKGVQTAEWLAASAPPTAT